jgi:hypothetical protein
MDGLTAYFEGLAKQFKDQSDKLVTFSNDLESMKNGKENNKPYSKQTIEPMTRLRSSVEELKEAKANPDEQFIKDQLHDILGI